MTISDISSTDNMPPIIEKEFLYLLQSNDDKLFAMNHHFLINDYNGKDFISRLPPDIIYEILKYFSPQEISVRIATLSKIFYQYSHNPLLWKDLNFEPFTNFSIGKLQRIMSFSISNVTNFDESDTINAFNKDNNNNRVNGIRSLIISGRESLDFYEILTLSPFLYSLKYLDVSYCYGINESSVELLLQICPQLNTLIAKSCISINEQAFCLLSGFKLLKILKLNYDSSLTDLALTTMATWLTNLENLTLKGITNISDCGISALAKERGQTLIKLEVDGSYISDKSISDISKSCKKLEILLFHTACKLTDVALEYIQNVKTLKHLKFARCKKFTEIGFLSFFDSNHMDRLEAIDFSECKAFTDLVAERMSLKHNERLKKLYLSFCWEMSDDGFQFILNNCPNLELLELAGLNRLSWLHVPDIPVKLPKLKYLDLRQCNTWIDDDIVKIVHKMPNLMVINFLGYEVYQKPGIGIIHSPRRFCE
ncbi:unnamed protein product [Gordionus sp. m RMFG-2023]